MKKLISLALAVAILFSLAVAVNAQADKQENGKSEKPVINAVETKTNNGAVASTTGSGLTITPAETIEGLKAQIKENHKDKEVRKYLLKVLVQLRYKGGDNSIPVLVNGVLMKFDVPPVIKQNRTLIPVRAITESLGAEVKWDPKLPDIVTIVKTVDGKVITVVIDLKTGIVTKSVDSTAPVEVDFDVKPQLVNNRTLVPIRFLAETFGMKVDYDPETQGVFVDETEEAEKVVEE